MRSFFLKQVELVTTLATLVLSPNVYAWDEAVEDHLVSHSLPRPPLPFPFYTHSAFLDKIPDGYPFNGAPNDPNSKNDNFRYNFHRSRHALGSPNPSIDGDRNIVSNLYFCPSASVLAYREGGGKYNEEADFTLPPDCEIVTPRLVSNLNDKALTSSGWVTARKAWAVRSPSEAFQAISYPDHTYITLEAAKLAGMGHLKPFNQPFWVRYPTKNVFMASPLEDDPSTFVVGPSWTPVDFSEMETMATRGVFLPDLAELPDAAFSLWDWAAGGEICPIEDDAKKTFAEKFANKHCHGFKGFLGALNMSHWPPFTRLFYNNYHSLAMETMAACKERFANFSQFYNYPYPYGYTYAELSLPETNTESHECELEALSYEMIAQHYLQDNWSTGHMWHRWGVLDWEKAPFALPGENQNDIPAGDLLPRKFIITGTLAGIVGSIHGAKALIGEDIVGPIGTGVLNFFHGDLADDPLNGPEYSFPQLVLSPGLPKWTFYPDQIPPSWLKKNYVSWRNDLSPSLYVPARGVGDLFWQFSGKDTQFHYTEQRNLMLSCAAQSLRDVYSAGPKAHGEFKNHTIPKDVSVESDQCWGPKVTDGSMAGGIGITNEALLYYFPGVLSPTSASMIGLINSVVVSKRLSVTQFTQGGESGFSLKLNNRLFTDMEKMANRFTFAAVTHQDQANLAKDPGPLLGQNPNVFVPNEVFKKVPYVDGYTPDPGKPEGMNKHFVEKMFWRSNLENVCKTFENGALLANLRTRCIGNHVAGSFGDTDACSACVSATELLVPITKSEPGGYIVGPSKCEAIGVSPTIPSEWRNLMWRTSFLDANPGLHPYWLAFAYCTDTESVSPSAGYKPIDATKGDPFDCDKGLNELVGIGRHSTILQDVSYDVDSAIAVPPPWVSTFTTSFEMKERTDFPGCSGVIVWGHERDGTSVFRQTIPFSPMDGDPERGILALESPWAPLAIPSCGPYQDNIFFNKPCASHLPAIQPNEERVEAAYTTADEQGQLLSGYLCSHRSSIKMATCPENYHCASSQWCKPQRPKIIIHDLLGVLNGKYFSTQVCSHSAKLLFFYFSNYTFAGSSFVCLRSSVVLWTAAKIWRSCVDFFYLVFGRLALLSLASGPDRF